MGTRGTYVSHIPSVREMAVDFDRAHWVTDSPLPVPNRSEDRAGSGYNLRIPFGHRIRHATCGKCGATRS